MFQRNTGRVIKHRSPNPQENLLSRPKMSSLWKVCCTYLYLAKGNLEAEAFVEVGVQSVLFDCRLLLLQPLALVLQHHFNEGIWQEQAHGRKECQLRKTEVKQRVSQDEEHRGQMIVQQIHVQCLQLCNAAKRLMFNYFQQHLGNQMSLTGHNWLILVRRV